MTPAATPTPRAVRRLLAVDPGLPDCGAAVFEVGVLVKAVWCRVAAPRPGLDARAATIVRLLDEVEALLDPPPFGDVVDAVIEWPEMLPRRGQWVNPAGLLWVAAVAAALADRVAGWRGAVHLVTPREWKGSVPKEQHQRVALHTLTAAERELLPRMPRAGRVESDAADAALLGAWWLHRQGLRQMPALEPRFHSAPLPELAPVLPVKRSRRAR